MKKKLIFLSTGLLLIDQILKVVVIKSMSLYESIKVIPNFMYITYIQNNGGAFGILAGSRLFFIIIGIITLVVLVKFILEDTKISSFDMTAYALVVSGIIGNLIDRIIYGKVIDYIDFRIFNYEAPVFNFADICIVFGAIMIIYILIVKGDSDENIYSRKRIK